MNIIASIITLYILYLQNQVDIYKALSNKCYVIIKKIGWFTIVISGERKSAKKKNVTEKMNIMWHKATKLKNGIFLGPWYITVIDLCR